MAEVIRKSTNKFTKGIVMDFSPENTKNDTLTYALNATLLTFNGNELSLQNDVGNARVETAYLPEGYIPVGTCEYGGIIYIVSYNPLEDKSQIGCFPSPERNISSDELGNLVETIHASDFIKDGTINNTSKCVLLKHDSLNPGDKFIISANESIYQERLADLQISTEKSEYKPVSNPVLALNVVSIEDSGKIVYLNSSLRTYEFNSDVNYKYHIVGSTETSSENLNNVDIDSYRNVLSSGYNVFRSKTSGKLAILAELIAIDSYSVTHSVVPRTELQGSNLTHDVGTFDVIIHTEVGPSLTPENYDVNPKLKYYYLQDSQGYLQGKDGLIPLFDSANKTSTFLDTTLDSVYQSTDELDFKNYSMKSGNFDFPKAKTYHSNMQVYTGDMENLQENKVYTKFSEKCYHRVKVKQIKGRLNDKWYQLDYFYNDLNAYLYKYNPNSTDYIKLENGEALKREYQYYIKNTKVDYVNANHESKYQNSILYKKEKTPQLASSEIIKDASIKKYEEIQTNSYTKASEYDVGPFYIRQETEAGYDFIKVENRPEEGVYYILKVTTSLEYVGTVIEDITDYNTLYYYPNTADYKIATSEEKEDYWKNNTDLVLYVKDEKPNFEAISEVDLIKYMENGTDVYYKNDYTPVYAEDIIEIGSTLNDNSDLFISVPSDAYVSYEMFKPDVTMNYISGKDKPEPLNYPKDDALVLYTVGDFLPINNEYTDVRLATLHLPPIITAKNLPDLPFKYDYTLVPCMNYGRLDKLAISNTVDFSKLRDFDKSDFSVWKYHIDGNQLSLTFGANVYDTFETNKVDGLILEFYDLRGFAGSLEILNKKAYSGTFTYIINLNTLGSIGKTKYVDGTLSTSYKHNVGVQKLKNEYRYKDTVLNFDKDKGWLGLNDSDNDCGTLYSNMLYGVKTYLRVTANDKITYIPKREFFLYTLPIYNDYYYNIDDFSTLHNPTLDMILTYKLEDHGSNQAYQDTKITNGYIDSEEIKTYLSGNFNKQTLETVKYYQYSGISKVYLEVGLKKDYEEFGLSYLPQINNYFKCTLALKGDSNKSFKIQTKDNVGSDYQKLNYNEDAFTSIPTNFVQFDNNDSIEYSISCPNFAEFNFINPTYQIPSYVAIAYNFVVGHKINIQNISAVDVPATTVCALCHKINSADYNYSDFNIRVANDEDGDKFYSDVMFYNTGDENTYIFGVCRQMSDSSTEKLTIVCSAYDTITDVPTPIVTKGKFNAGEPLKQMSSYIGKLSIGQPHVHGLSDEYKTNIASNADVVFPEKVEDVYVVDGKKWPCLNWEDTVNDMSPSMFNLVANTKDSIKYSSEFISVIPYAYMIYNKDKGPRRSYIGLSPSRLEHYNAGLIKSMKSIYAYNPDYSTVSIKRGDIVVENKEVQIISNLISKDAEFNFAGVNTFNDFILLSGIPISTYLEDLSTYSDVITHINNEPIPQLNFVPGCKYCGKDPYLISSITYNIPEPTDLEEELQFQNKDLIVVKHENASTSILKGDIDKKRLYGFCENHLIQLDVSNYTIDYSTGALEIDTDTITKVEYQDFKIDFTPIVSSIPSISMYALNTSGAFKVINKTHQFIGDRTGNSNIPIKSEFFFRNNEINSGNVLYTENNTFVIKTNINTGKHQISIRMQNTFGETFNPIHTVNPVPRGNLISKDTYKYSIIPVVVCSYQRILLHSDFAKGGDHELETLSPDLLNSLLEGTTNVVDGDSYIFLHTSDVKSSQATENSDVDISIDEFINKDDSYVMALYKITLETVYYHVARHSYIHHMLDHVINVPITPTNTYSNWNANVYTVNDEYLNRCLVNTSITLNDLEYDPSLDGHRLYVNSARYKYCDDPKNRIYYRKNNDGDTKPNVNCLYVYTGPCFMPYNYNHYKFVEIV